MRTLGTNCGFREFIGGTSRELGGSLRHQKFDLCEGRIWRSNRFDKHWKTLAVHYRGKRGQGARLSRLKVNKEE